jgi:poly(3-hydroxyalkanoate) synthetase
VTGHHGCGPSALLALAAERDSIIPLDAVRSVAARAGEPKRLVVLPIGHFEVYEEPWRARAVEEAVGWLRTHL